MFLNTNNWLSTGAGKTGLSHSYAITLDWAAAELYIYRGSDSADENERIFDALCAKKDEIERAFGGPLVWDRMEGRRACRVRARLDLGGLRHRGRWPEIQEAMIDAMARLSAVLRREI